MHNTVRGRAKATFGIALRGRTHERHHRKAVTRSIGGTISGPLGGISSAIVAPARPSPTLVRSQRQQPHQGQRRDHQGRPTQAVQQAGMEGLGGHGHRAVLHHNGCVHAVWVQRSGPHSCRATCFYTGYTPCFYTGTPPRVFTRVPIRVFTRVGVRLGTGASVPHPRTGVFERSLGARSHGYTAAGPLVPSMPCRPALHATCWQ